MKNARHGQATPIDRKLYAKIRAEFNEDWHRLFFDLAFYTGERWGAIVQLRVSDVFDSRSRALAEITFRKQTTKGKSTRTVPTHPHLVLRLQNANVPSGLWLFPSDCPDLEIRSIRGIDAAFRRATDRAGLSGLGLSPYSTRRGFITQLDRQGTSLKVIQSLTGHKSISSLVRYIDVSDEQKINAISSI